MNVVIAVLLAAEIDHWGPAIFGNIAQGGIAVAFAWYLLVKVGPKNEEAHQKQLLEQRVDLLALVQKERETLERVLSVISDARYATIAKVGEGVVQMHSGIDQLTRTVEEMRDELRKSNHFISEGLRETKEELKKLNEKSRGRGN